MINFDNICLASDMHHPATSDGTQCRRSLQGDYIPNNKASLNTRPISPLRWVIAPNLVFYTKWCEHTKGWGHKI